MSETPDVSPAVPPTPSLPVLSAEETRVLGVLLEKALSTPEYYPLSLNALVMGCNQKNNRQPVVAYDDALVVRALDALREKQLAAMVTEAGARVPKYRQRAAEQLGLDEKDQAVLAELLLRGPQTVGELKNRGERMAPLGDLMAVQAVLDGLAGRPAALVARLPRQAGMKECRYTHLLAGAVVAAGEDVETGPAPEPARVQVLADQARLAALEQEVLALKIEVQALRQELAVVRRQFE